MGQAVNPLVRAPPLLINLIQVRFFGFLSYEPDHPTTTP